MWATGINWLHNKSGSQILIAHFSGGLTLNAVWETIREFLDQGGPVVVTIGFVIFVMWFLVFERLLYVFTENRDRVKNGLTRHESRGDPKSWASRAIYDADVSRLSLRMDSGVEIIRTLATLCPLLGLLGTVTGMIVIFDVMAALGSSSPRAFAGGIARATLPTMAGMVGALSGLFPAAVLARYARQQEQALYGHHMSAAEVGGALLSGIPTFVRVGIALITAFFVTAALLFLMQTLIETGRDAISNRSPVEFVDFIRIRRAERIETREEKPQKIMPEAKPEVVRATLDNSDMDAGIDIGMSSTVTNLQIGGFAIGAKLGDYGISDAEYMPIVRVVPMYPRQAAMLGIEGYVIVSFTVTTNGSVKDCIVVESSNAIFNRSAVQAALKFKYKPRLVDGVAMEVHDVQTKLTYAFEE
jgi:biopolymer transport protein ExbB